MQHNQPKFKTQSQIYKIYDSDDVKILKKYRQINNNKVYGPQLKIYGRLKYTAPKNREGLCLVGKGSWKTEKSKCFKLESPTSNWKGFTSYQCTSYQGHFIPKSPHTRHFTSALYTSHFMPVTLYQSLNPSAFNISAIRTEFTLYLNL